MLCPLRQNTHCKSTEKVGKNMKLFYIKICKRINMFALTEYCEYFISETGMKYYINLFEEYLYSEDNMWITSTGTARVNKNDMIVAETETEYIRNIYSKE